MVIWVVLMLLTLVVGVVGVVFFSLPYAQAKTYVDALSRDGNLESFSLANFTKLSQPIRLFGFAMLAVGLALLLMPVRTRGWIKRFVVWSKQKWEAFRVDASLFKAALIRIRPNKWIILALLILILVAAGVRWASIGRAMGHDEAYTFEAFASRPLAKFIGDYHLPNNHILHTILVHISYKIFGDAPWAVRLPAFLAGVFLVPAAYWIGKKMYTWSVGILGAAVVAVAPVMISYSTNARGYTLLALLTLLSWALGIYLKSHRNRLGWLLLSLLWALGFYTLPIMLYPFGMLWLWLLFSGLIGDTGKAYASRWDMPRYLVIFGALAAVLAVLFYSPVFFSSGIASFTSNTFVEPLSWSEFWQTLPHRLEDTWLEWNAGFPYQGMIVLVGFGLSLVFHRQISRHIIPMQLVAVLWIAITFLIQRPNPWSRIWVYLFPPMALWGAAGWLGLVQSIRLPFLKSIRFADILALVAAASLLGFGAYQAVKNLPETTALREVEKTTLFLKDHLQPGDVIAMDYPWDVPFWYYARRHALPVDSYKVEKGQLYQRVFVVVSPGYEQTVAMVLATHAKKGITCAFNSIHMLEKIDNIVIYECEKQ